MKKPIAIFILFLILGIGFSYILFNRVNVKIEPGKFSGVKAVLYQSPFCGCCGNYVTYLKTNGFAVEVKKVSDKELEKLKHNIGLSYNLTSCHTAFIYKSQFDSNSGNDYYFVEGHIPIEAIEKLLAEKPKIKGIALPGMPSGFPGMSGVKLETWKIYQINENGKIEIFMEI